MPAELCEMIRDARADNAAAHDDHLRFGGQRIRPHSKFRKREQPGAARLPNSKSIQ